MPEAVHYLNESAYTFHDIPLSLTEKAIFAHPQNDMRVKHPE